MKKFKSKFLSLLCLIFLSTFLSAQGGLEGIEVEVYYESTAATSALLPAGSKTYRLYVNLLPGYTLQSYSGDDVNIMSFTTTTTFFNDPDNGGNFANDVANGVLGTGAALVDSWFSFGSGGGTRRGVLKVNDTDGGIAATPLTNSGGAMGSPLTTHDGRFNTGNALAVSSAGADLTLPPYDIFNNATVGGSFTTAALPGGFGMFSAIGAATGPGPDNRILIGQFTTDGAFGYRIGNLQLGTPTPGVSENYFANNPAHAALGLVLEPNLGSPTVNIPGGNITSAVGTTVTINATASDVAPGTIAQVEFFNGATSIGVDNTAPYSVNFTVLSAPATITAVATDNQGATATSNAITVGAAPNVPPTNMLTASLTSIIAGDNTTLTSSATDSDGTIVDVKFYSGPLGSGTLINTDNTAPYEFIVSPATTTSYYSIAMDNSGATTTSNAVTVNVVANQSPVVSLTAPATNTDVFVPAVVTFSANATDADGTITNVEFLVNGAVVGTDNTAPYSYDWTSTATGGFVTFAARATDNKGAVTTSATRMIRARINTGTKYEVKEVTELCNASTICVPVAAKATVTDVIGYDLELRYPKNKLIPTGLVRKYGDLAPVNLFETAQNVIPTSTNAGKMLVAVYFNTTAPSTQRFAGIGDLVCVEFEKKPSFQADDSVYVVVDKLQESYINGPEIELCDSNKYKTYKQTMLNANLQFWADRSPIAYTAGVNLITNIKGNDLNCSNQSAVAVQPNENGEFTHDLNNGLMLNIIRDIYGSQATEPAGTDVQSVINGFDALLVKKVLIEDLSFVPNIYQILSMDVNLDGYISAGDASQINQRAVLRISEFRQAWNYNNDGTKKAGKGDSKDWQFIDETTLLNGNNVDYSISANYPRWDNSGYNKDHVPVPDTCRQTPVSDWTRCAVVGTDTYIGLLMGDVNGNYKNQSASATLRSRSNVSFDLSDAIISNNTITIPVTFSASEDVNAIDFSVKFDENVLTYVSSSSTMENSMINFNESDRTLRFTSYSLKANNENTPVAYLTFTKNSDVNERDFSNGAAYINGDKVNFEVVNAPKSSDNSLFSDVKLYPNPTSDVLNIATTNAYNAELIDATGKQMMDLGQIKNSNKFDISTLNNGVYFVKLTDGSKVEMKKIIVVK